MKTLNLILAIVGVVVISFIIVMIITFWKFQSVPDTLVACVLGSGSAELLFSALITITKRKYGGDDE